MPGVRQVVKGLAKVGHTMGKEFKVAGAQMSESVRRFGHGYKHGEDSKYDDEERVDPCLYNTPIQCVARL
jgi:hypothetical protein